MVRRINTAGLVLIKNYEGLRLRSYRCPAGVWTIGYGHTDGVLPRMSITEEEAEAFLKEDIDRFEKGVSALVEDVPCNENEFSAYVSLAFNIGLYGFSQSTTLRLFRSASPREEAADAMLLWNKGRVDGKLVLLPGLVKRRNAERKLFLTPVMSHDNSEDMDGLE